MDHILDRYISLQKSVFKEIHVFRFVRKIAKIYYQPRHTCPSVRLSVWPSVRLSVWPSVRPSVRMKQLGSQCTDFFFNLIFENLSKICQKRQVSLKSDKNKLLYMKTNIHSVSCLAHFFLEWDLFQTTLSRKLERAFYTQEFFL